MQRSYSAVRLAAVTSTPAPPLIGRGGRPIAIDFPSRIVPFSAIATITSTLLLSFFLNQMYNHTDSVLRWPYVSDFGVQQPEAGVMAFGMVATSVAIFSVIIINYGKIKNNLALVGSGRGWKRNVTCAVCGVIGAPSLGASACFDTARTPRLHFLFVMTFFVTSGLYLFFMTNIYMILLKYEPQYESKELTRLQQSRWITLKSSVKYKQLFGAMFVLSAFLYLPVGGMMVSDFSDYTKDTLIHEYRVLAQYTSVASIILYYSSFYWDFGNFQLFLVQGGLPVKNKSQ